MVRQETKDLGKLALAATPVAGDVYVWRGLENMEDIKKGDKIWMECMFITLKYMTYAFATGPAMKVAWNIYDTVQMGGM